MGLIRGRQQNALCTFTRVCDGEPATLTHSLRKIPGKVLLDPSCLPLRRRYITQARKRRLIVQAIVLGKGKEALG